MRFKTFFESITVYHGAKSPVDNWNNPHNQKSGYYPGIYTFADKEMTKRHGSYTYEFNINPDKFYKMTDDGSELKKLAAEAGFPVTQGSGYPECKYLKSIGIEGIQRGLEYIILRQ